MPKLGSPGVSASIDAFLPRLNSPTTHTGQHLSRCKIDERFHFAPLAPLAHSSKHTRTPSRTRQHTNCSPVPWIASESNDFRMQDGGGPIGSDIQSGSFDVQPDRDQPTIPRTIPKIPSPGSNSEAYLLLEAARSDRQISSLKKDLAFEIVHRNAIALQLNRIMLERVQEDLNVANEFIGYVRLSIRESGHSVAAEYAMRETQSPRCCNDSFPAPPYTLDVVLD